MEYEWNTHGIWIEYRWFTRYFNIAMVKNSVAHEVRWFACPASTIKKTPMELLWKNAVFFVVKTKILIYSHIMEVSYNGGTPKSSHFSWIVHDKSSIWSTPIYGNPLKKLTDPMERY